PMWGLDIVRKWERRFTLTAEYALMATYAEIVRLGVRPSQRPEDLVIHAWIDNAPERIFGDHRVRKIKMTGERSYVIALPRQEAFTPLVTELVTQGVRFRDIAGNDEILLTVIASSALELRLEAGEVLLKEPLLTNPAAARVAVKTPVRSLGTV